MSSFSDGGFEIRREPERDSKAGGYGFGLWIHTGGGHYKHLPISKAGGSCHNQSPVICDNIAGLMRLGETVAAYDGRVQAIAQMGLNAGMPLWYDYDSDVMPTPATKIGGMMRNGFNRGIYWGVARGLV